MPIIDVGQQIPASGQLTIDPSDYDKYAQSAVTLGLISLGTLVVNDGSIDLSVLEGSDLIKGIYHARNVPFNNAATSFLVTDTQSALEDIRKRRINENTQVTTSLNGTTTATVSSNSAYVFTGTATGHKFDLPAANTCSIGHKFEIWNFSSQPISIRDNGGNVLVTTLKANARTEIMLRNNSTANGVWGITYTLDNGNVFGTNVLFNSSEGETSNNSGTVWVTKLSLVTPADLALGDYLLKFQFIWRSSSANREADFRYQLNGSNVVAWSPSTARTQDRQLLSGFFRLLSIQGVNTVTFDFKWIGSSTTIFVSQARMLLWRIG